MYIVGGDKLFFPDTCKVSSVSKLADNVTLVLDTDLPERIVKGTELKLGCSEGFTLVKRGVLTCGDDGIWQGDLPECARKCMFTCSVYWVV